MRLALVLPALLLSIPTRPLLAQYMSIGDPIQIELAERPTTFITGTLAGVTEDSIFVARSQLSDVRLARGEVKTLYVAREHGDMGEAGAIIGMPAGILLGGIGGALLAGPRIVGRVLGGAVGAFVGGGLGLIAGGEIGSREHGQSWVAIPWPSTPIEESPPR